MLDIAVSLAHARAKANNIDAKPLIHCNTVYRVALIQVYKLRNLCRIMYQPAMPGRALP